MNNLGSAFRDFFMFDIFFDKEIWLSISYFFTAIAIVNCDVEKLKCLLHKAVTYLGWLFVTWGGELLNNKVDSMLMSLQ